MAIPLAIVYNQTLNSLSWPKIWKSETVTVIPKNSAPASLKELRNLSCTPLFSKVLESFVLERLKSEINLSPRQFGGIKGCGTEHFLIETWDAIMSALDDGTAAANLLSVDFEKAFNRMDHHHCLFALSDLGASDTSIDWVASFLHGRTMSVKIHGVMSKPRTVPGGSPQGSILGNFLFCATTDRFANLDVVLISAIAPGQAAQAAHLRKVPILYLGFNPPVNAMSTPSSRGQFASFVPPRSLLDLSGEYQSDEENFEFFRIRNRYEFDSSSEEDIETEVNVPDTLCPDPLVKMVYIDDYNSIEKIRIAEAESHITVHKRKIHVLAQKSEKNSPLLRGKRTL